MRSKFPSIDWPAFAYAPVVPELPADYDVLDMTVAIDPATVSNAVWTIGRYAERRAMYTADLFAGERCVHAGIDIGGPVGTSVHAFFDGSVHAAGYNAADGDYGHVIVTEHVLGDVTIWALCGHLDARSSARWQAGDTFVAGDVLGWFGAAHENGGWSPHLHFQLAREAPATHDMPGAVRPDQVDWMRVAHPDPRVVLGPLY